MAYFGEKLRALRIEHGLSQSELAAQLGMTKSRINMYERGEREPKFDIAAQLAMYFNVDICELLGIPRTAHTDRLADAPRAGTDAAADALTPDERALLEAYRTLSEEEKSYIRQVITLTRRLGGK